MWKMFGTNLKRHCCIQPKRCMGLPKTINGKSRTGVGSIMLMKPSNRNARVRFNIYKVVDNKSKSNEVEKAKAAYNEAKSTGEE